MLFRSAAQIAKGFIEDDRIKLAMEAPRVLLPKNQVKLFLNLLMIATTAIPRGGQIIAFAKADGERGEFTISATGTNARIPPHVEGLLAHNREGVTIDAHAIQPYYTGLIASEAGFEVGLSIEGETVRIKAQPKA